MAKVTPGVNWNMEPKMHISHYFLYLLSVVVRKINQRPFVPSASLSKTSGLLENSLMTPCKNVSTAYSAQPSVEF